MNKLPCARALMLVTLGLLTSSAAARSQATHTWVSATGDDTYPCSQTAPCRTFGGAISKTASGGEIHVLTRGNFGGVTITKSITISSEKFDAGVFVSGSNAIVVAAAPTDSVVLRGLDIEGAGTGLVGVKVLGGLGSLIVEKCTINNFRGSNGSGIEVAPTTAGTMKLFIKDTIVRRNGQGTGGGIFVHPGAGVNVKGSLDNVRMENNNFGLRVQDNTNVTVTNSIAAGNTNAGFTAAQVSAGNPIELLLDHCVSSSNGTFGLVTNGTTNAVTASITKSTFTNNATGIQVQGGSQVVTAGDNFNTGNVANGSPIN